MKRAVRAFLVVALFTTFPLLAAQTRLVDDVIRMSQAGVSDDTIITYVQHAADRAAVTADDLIALKKAGVSKAVIKAMIDMEPARGPQPAAENREPDAPPPADAQTSESAASGPSNDGGCDTFEPPILIGDLEPFYPAWLWDPYWYMPRLDTRGGTDTVAGHTPATPHSAEAAAPRIARDSGYRPSSTPRRAESGGRSGGGSSARHR